MGSEWERQNEWTSYDPGAKVTTLPLQYSLLILKSLVVNKINFSSKSLVSLGTGHKIFNQYRDLASHWFKKNTAFRLGFSLSLQRQPVVICLPSKKKVATKDLAKPLKWFVGIASWTMKCNEKWQAHFRLATVTLFRNMYALTYFGAKKLLCQQRQIIQYFNENYLTAELQSYLWAPLHRWREPPPHCWIFLFLVYFNGGYGQHTLRLLAIWKDTGHWCRLLGHFMGRMDIWYHNRITHVITCE